TAASRLAVDVSLGAQRIPLSADRVRDFVRRTLLAEHVREAMMSVAFVSSHEIARLNREHLGHAGPTDVISFALGSAPGAGARTKRESPAGATGFALRRALRRPPSRLSAGPDHARVVGDIYICPDVVRKNAARYGSGIREEISRVVVHGTLHTLGYEHSDGEDRTGSEMWRKQEEILARVL
ncbi:MAG: rRNA maturation RNase YbeY, partial [Gemmatimonadaceae bacterium]